MCLEIKISTFQLIELHCINDELKILKLNLQQLALQYAMCMISGLCRKTIVKQYLLYKKWNPGAQVSYVANDTNAI